MDAPSLKAEAAPEALERNPSKSTLLLLSDTNDCLLEQVDKEIEIAHKGIAVH